MELLFYFNDEKPLKYNILDKELNRTKDPYYLEGRLLIKNNGKELFNSDFIYLLPCLYELVVADLMLLKEDSHLFSLCDRPPTNFLQKSLNDYFFEIWLLDSRNNTHQSFAVEKASYRKILKNTISCFWEVLVSLGYDNQSDEMMGLLKEYKDKEEII